MVEHPRTCWVATYGPMEQTVGGQQKTALICQDGKTPRYHLASQPTLRITLSIAITGGPGRTCDNSQSVQRLLGDFRSVPDDPELSANGSGLLSQGVDLLLPINSLAPKYVNLEAQLQYHLCFLNAKTWIGLGRQLNADFLWNCRSGGRRPDDGANRQTGLRNKSRFPCRALVRILCKTASRLARAK